MTYTINEIAGIIPSRQHLTKEARIEWLLTDSRSLSFPESTLFFALKTKRGDGQDYIDGLYKKGVYNFVVCTSYNDDLLAERYANANFLFVDDTLVALQQLASHVRCNLSIPIIGITGSNGKTVTKEWLYQLMNKDWHVTRSPRSYNSQIGVPLALWLLDSGTELGIFEAGISEPGEMARLQRMIKPTIGVLTNIGNAHQENFSSLKEKCLEKMKLFTQCKFLVCNGDDRLIMDCAREMLEECTLLTWSRKDANCFLYIKGINKGEAATKIVYQCRGEEHSYVFPFTDDASIQDSFACLAVCLHFGMDTTVIAGRMAVLEAVEMRLEVVDGVNNCVIINDSYNSDFSSLEIALNFLQRRDRGGRRKKTLILSDLLESGFTKDELYSSVSNIIKEKKIDKVIGIGHDIKAMKQCYDGDAEYFDTTTDFLRSDSFNRHNEIILIKGARDFHFEEIAERLEQKIHKTIMEIDLNAVIANLNHYRSMLLQGTKVVCMVKAAAYGSGAREIARTLQDHNVDCLAVAVVDEGVELRNAGITIPIMIMDPEVSSFKTLFRNNLEPEVYDFRLLDELIAVAEHSGITNYPVHIKLDTGMHRLGFEERDLPRLIEKLKSQTALIPKSIFSHFATSDDTSMDEYTRRQADLFIKLTNEFQKHFSHKIIRHLCNTAGIERFPEYHFDMVRLGLGLYGVNPIDNSLLNNVSSLITTILQIRDVKPGDAVGYGRRGEIDRATRIATIPIGYADGLNRHLGNRKGFCMVNGIKAQYVGNICMDACMIDVTGIDCKEGDKVEIFGNNLPVTTISDLLGTIPYEILTVISNRVKRVYFHD